MLTQASIAHYLLSLGIVKPSAVVEDELSVLDASRRNAVFIASARSGPAFVVKQARAHTAATLAREATMLRAARGEARAARHGARGPARGPRGGLPGTATPADAADWSEHQATRRFPRVLRAALGRALATLHELPPTGGRAPGRTRAGCGA